MAEIHSKRIDENKLDTVLAEDISFEGDISFSKPLMIKGIFSGSIDATGDLFIDKDAVVDAEIKAYSVVVRGKVKGNITAGSKVELQGTAEVVGDITAPRIVMEPGCLFDGISKMRPADEV
jgi:cytoskeletal protein CcmA (bactofilin family)